MGEDEKKVRNINDYYEYPKQERGKIGLADTIQAAVNTITANVTQKKLVNNTAERYSISGDDIEEFLYANYKDEKSKEYLVNGAILTCTNCTKENVEIKDGDKIYECHAKENTDIDTTSISDWDIDKVAGKLIVTENPASEVTGLHNATVVDSERENNIPYFGNCKRNPDSEQELNEFRKIHGEGRGVIKIEEGSCKYLMKLEEKWENYEIGQEFVSYTDDKKGKNSGITMTSILFCKHGGFIYPVTSGQTAESEELILIYKAEIGALVSGKSGEKERAAQAGVPVRYNISTYLDKAFEKNSPCYYIVNHDNTYIDENGLLRISKTPGFKLESDYYCVAMAPGFTTLAEEYCTPAEEGNVNFGYKLQICFSDKNENEYSMDVVVTTTKASSDINDFYPHDNLVEFVVDGKPKDTITTEGNVSFDKLLGGSGLEITKVYAYREGAMITGGWWPQGHWEDR